MLKLWFSNSFKICGLAYKFIPILKNSGQSTINKKVDKIAFPNWNKAFYQPLNTNRILILFFKQLIF